MFDPKSHTEAQTAKGLAKRMAEKAISLDGTCTGEHGVGVGKMDLLTKEMGDGSIKVLFLDKILLCIMVIVNEEHQACDGPAKYSQSWKSAPHETASNQQETSSCAMSLACQCYYCTFSSCALWIAMRDFKVLLRFRFSKKVYGIVVVYG